jgi:predicted RecB family endonuclease
MRKVYLVIIWTITLACIVFGSMRFTGHFTPFDGHTKKGSQSLEGTLNSIELNGDAFDVTIQKGNENKVSYRSKYKPEISLVNGRLTIKEHTSKRRFFFARALSVTITVKDDLDTITLNSKQGDIDIKSIKAKNMMIETKAGDIDIADCEGENLFVDTKAGDIDITRGNIQNIKVESSAGDIDCDRTLFTTLKCNLLAGDCDIKGQEDLSDYSYNLEVKFGDLDVNGTSYSKRYVKEGSAKRIDIEVKAGDIDIS